MVHQRALATTLLLLPTLALGAPNHGRVLGRHVHDHAHRRAPAYYTTYTTVNIVETVWVGEQPTEAAVNAYEKPTTQATYQPPAYTQSPAAPPAYTESPAAPPAEKPSSSSTSFVTYSPPPSSSSAQAQPTGGSSLPAGSAGLVTFKNNCGDSVRISKVPPPSCGSSVTKNLANGEDWTDKFEECAGGNIALKVYHLNADDSQPVHYEYGLNTTQKMAWYNLSFVNCVKHDAAGNPDLSACVGNQWMIGSCESCSQYKCTESNPKACCSEANGGYCDPYATAAAEQPVGGCGEPNHAVSDLLINMQLC